MTALPEIIRTDRLELRPFSELDGPAVYAYSRDEDWQRFQKTTPASKVEAERVVEELCAQDRSLEPVWAISRVGRAIGIVSLSFLGEHRRAVLGFGIHRDHRGLGLAEEAVRAVLAAAFVAHPQLEKVMANSDARNHRSHRLLERLGFRFASKARVHVQGRLLDGSIHHLVRSEWAA